MKQGRGSFCNTTNAILLSLTLMYFPVLLNNLLLSIGKALPQQELSSAKWFIDLNVEICKQLGWKEQGGGGPRYVNAFTLACQICLSFITQ